MLQKICVLLFDLDSTLIDTGELHYEATVKALISIGGLIDQQTYDQNMALTTPTLRNFCFRMEALSAMRNMWV